jgi:hypothetical protein
VVHLGDDQFDPDEDEDSSDTVLEERKNLDEDVDDKEGGSQTEHGEYSGGVSQEEITDLSDDGGNAIDSEENVGDFEAAHNEEEHSSAGLVVVDLAVAGGVQVRLGEVEGAVGS